jgi:hypothetical protein
MENYDILVVDPPTYARALAEVKRAADGPPHPIADAIVVAMMTLATVMHEQETECGLCDHGFAVKEPPPEYLRAVPADGSDSPPIAMPPCHECARLSDAERGARLKAALLRIPGARERKPN